MKMLRIPGDISDLATAIGDLGILKKLMDDARRIFKKPHSQIFEL